MSDKHVTRRRIRQLLDIIYLMLNDPKRKFNKMLLLRPKRATKDEIMYEALEIYLALVMGKLNVDIETVRDAVLEAEAELLEPEIAVRT